MEAERYLNLSASVEISEIYFDLCQFSGSSTFLLCTWNRYERKVRLIQMSGERTEVRLTSSAEKSREHISGIMESSLSVLPLLQALFSIPIVDPSFLLSHDGRKTFRARLDLDEYF